VTVTAASAPTGWTAGRVVAVVLGTVVGLASLGLVTAGGAALVADNAFRDSAGYVTSPDRTVSSVGYAVAMPSVRIDTAPGASMLPRRVVGDVRLLATAGDGRSLFVGIARADAVEQYLGGVARSIPDQGWSQGREVAGQAPSGPPTDLSIWDESVVGTGTQELTWTPRSGDWAVVLMNADGSAGVDAQVSVGAEIPWLGGVGVAVLVTGLVLLALGVTLVATAARGASRHPSGAPR
jgi:hypothetical protein